MLLGGIVLQVGFQLERVVEMILDHAFTAVGDDQNILDSGSDSLLNDVLNRGLIHNIEHFLWNGLGSGEHAGPHTSGRNNCFSYFHNTILP